MKKILLNIIVMASAFTSLSVLAVEDGKLTCKGTYEKTDIETHLYKAHVLAVKNLNDKAILLLEAKMAKIELDAKDCEEYTKNSRDFLVNLNSKITSLEELAK